MLTYADVCRPLSFAMRRPDAFDFSDPALAFDQILVVSLARDLARYERVSRMLDGLGLTNHRRFNAFDASGAQFTSTTVHMLDGLGLTNHRRFNAFDASGAQFTCCTSTKVHMLDGLGLTNYR
jgi:hypothetical protein